MNSGAPPSRTGHICVAYENYILVWGGYKENASNLTNTYFLGCEIWIYDCTSEQWFLKYPLTKTHPPGMSGSTAVVIGDTLYLFGGYGYNREGCVNHLYKLDLNSFEWEQLKPAGCSPIPVDKMVSWTHDHKFYIFGGFGDPDGGQNHNFEFVFCHLIWRGWTNQFFEYDPEKNQWKKPFCTGVLPSARAAHAAAVMKGKVYIFGGRHGAFRLNDMHSLDMETMHWSGKMALKSPVPQGRSWHSLTALADTYLVLYGGFSQNDIALSDSWLFNTETEIWQPLELPYQKPRVWHCACLSMYNEVVVYGGCKSNILDPARVPDQETDTIFIRISPKSLFRLVCDKVLEHPSLYSEWQWLPYKVQNLLRRRYRVTYSRSLEGS